MITVIVVTTPTKKKKGFERFTATDTQTAVQVATHTAAASDLSSELEEVFEPNCGPI